MLQTPVYNLLGGRVRDTIPLSHSIPWGSPEEMAAMVRNESPHLFLPFKPLTKTGLGQASGSLSTKR